MRHEEYLYQSGIIFEVQKTVKEAVTLNDGILRRISKSLELLCVMAGVVLLLHWAGKLFYPLLPLTLGVSIAALLRPMSLWMQKHTRLPCKAAASITLVIFYAAFAAAAITFGALLFSQMYDMLLRLPSVLSERLSQLMANLSGWASSLPGRFFPAENVRGFTQAVLDAVKQTAVSGSSRLVGWAAAAAARLPMLLLGAMCTVVISVLSSFYYDGIGGFLRSLAGKKYAPLLSEAGRFLRETVWQYAKAYSLLTAVTFLELLAGLWLLGFDYVVPLACMIALVDLLPLVGCGIVLIPWGLALLAMGDVAGGGLLVLYLVMGLVRNVLEPRVVSGQTGLHPVITVAVMYAGLSMGGLLGMLLAPVLALAFLRLGRFYWGVSPQRAADGEQR